MGEQFVYITGACILAVIIAFLPKLIQVRVWVLRRVHLFRLADWHERNIATIVTVLRAILTVLILALLLLMMGT